jgi:hypothetical protein
MQIDFAPLENAEDLNILELQFTTMATAPDETTDGAATRKNCVPYCSIQEIIAALSLGDSFRFNSQQSLNELIERYRGQAQKTILDPLLPLAVLIDGFVVAQPHNLTEWFRPGIDAALQASSQASHAADQQEYWDDLEESGSAVNRIGKILGKPVEPLCGSAAVLMRAKQIGWGTADPRDVNSEARVIYAKACEAVKAVWSTLTSTEEVPGGETEMRRLIEAASVGFHVLAVGHL